MKRVGIVSCYFKNNYGSMLQAYATKKVLDNKGVLNETINIENNIDFKKGKLKYYKTQILNFKFIKNKFGMIKLKIDKKLHKKLGENIRIRTSKYNEFKKEFNLSIACTNYKELGVISKNKYTDIIVGSDQLWLPVNVVADYYTLNWVPDTINKISYATSFGFSSVPKKYNDKYRKFLKKINHLSVREQSGVEIIKNIANIDAKLVADPTLLLTREEWEKEAIQERIYKDNYILCYFLGSNIEHRKFAERLKEKTGCKIVSLNHADEYVKYSDTFCDYAPFNIGPREWINLIQNADYVCTDSFHGTVFSIIFNKRFFDFRRHQNKSKISTNSRIDSLLNIAGISKERILTGKEEIEDVLKYNINYDEVNKNIENFRENSKKWLFDAITWKKEEEKPYIEIDDKSKCCGCTACKNICPKNAIEMVEDNEGFLYPNIDSTKCINCGACKRVCPVKNAKNILKEQKGIVLNHVDNEIRKDSTSGGAFTPIAKYVLNLKGVVFGACLDKENNVCHDYIEDINDLHKFRGSKYVQSDLKDSFKKVKNFLEEERYVCFSGTPCQIEGLKNYLQKEYDKLVTVDVMCHAVPSPLVWKKYYTYIKNNKLKGEEPTEILFRDKSKYGFKYSMMTLKSNNYTYSSGVETDPYLRAFFGDLSDRPSCYECAFKKQNHESDFTMWDCFIAENFDKKLDDDKGTSRLLINTPKARKIFEEIKNEFNYKEVEVEKLVKNVKEMTQSVTYNGKRHEFFDDLNKISEKQFFEKYFPITFKVRTERFVRVFLAKTGLYKKIKGIAKKILKK